MIPSTRENMPIKITIHDEVDFQGEKRWIGQVRLVGADQLSEVMILTFSGRYIAVPLACKHAGASLIYAPVEGNTLVCPRHGHAYELVGQNSIAYDVLSDNENFFLITSAQAVSPDVQALKDRIHILEMELEAKSAANTALEEQVVSGMEDMDRMFSEMMSRKTEWKEKSQRLTKLNELVNRVTNTISEVIIIAGPDGHIQRVNKTALSVYGCEEDEFLGRSVDDLLANKDLERFAEDYKGQLNLNKPLLYQLCFAVSSFEAEVSLRFEITSNGNAAIAHPYLLRATRLYDSQGKEEGAIFVCSDISKIKEREYRLRQKENEKSLHLLEATLNQINHGIAVFDETGELLVSNQAFVMITGCDQHWAAPGTSYEKFHQLEMESLSLCTLSPDQRDLNSLRQKACSWESYYHDGRVVDNDTNLMEDGGFVWVSQDVTSLREDAETMRRLSYALEQSPAEVIITNTDGVIEYVNAKFTENTGFSREQAIGHKTSMVRSGHMPHQYYENLWETLKQGKDWSGEVLNKRKDGSLFWQLLSIAPMYEPDGSVQRYLAIKENIDERKKAEEELSRHRDHLQELVDERSRELIKARDEAEQANRAKSEFLSSMSHELRTPLNGILGFAQLMEMSRKDKLSETQREYTQHIFKAGQHLLGLINEILDLAKIEAGKMQLNIMEVDLVAAVSDSIDLVQNMADDRSVTLHNQIDEDVISVYGDPVRLKQVVVNILSNAIKYNRDEGDVFLCVEQEEDALVLSISDSGYGIAKDKMKDLFTPFNRLGVEGQNIEGSGIGLTITRKLVTMMGGDIQVESEEGKGSTFSLYLPTTKPDFIENEDSQLQSDFIVGFNNEIIEEEDGAGPSHTSGKTILYAEDNPSNQFLIERAISNLAGVELVMVNDAKSAVTYAKRHTPDLILMDINLPGMNGFEAMNILRNDVKTQAIPVIALSAKALPEDIEHGLKSGFRAYVTKPVNIPDLLGTINRTFEKKII
ncbi:putative Histidine kinase [Candidatus Terasakiella magnetica]|uniref:histidine kinase n=1 Tax=Candidatus Terasakiella magnetica TaxID=1867952 RepID=A0A1C3RLU3_9PROT|nr:PAS domain S-box protein [Candidatus Terasakiella magnetica]SCA58255.1 putative Histidine kinase [Candidatus Terasakiella magnetica]